MMRYANKMKLVPADTIDHKFVGIDQELYNILTNKNLSTDAKTNHYNQIINRAVKKSNALGCCPIARRSRGQKSWYADGSVDR